METVMPLLMYDVDKICRYTVDIIYYPVLVGRPMQSNTTVELFNTVLWTKYELQGALLLPLMIKHWKLKTLKQNYNLKRTCLHLKR